MWKIVDDFQKHRQIFDDRMGVFAGCFLGSGHRAGIVFSYSVDLMGPFDHYGREDTISAEAVNFVVKASALFRRYRRSGFAHPPG